MNGLISNIYYFTGTGNSLQIAEDLKGSLEGADISKIAEYDGEKINGDKLVIVFPVYNWGTPLIINDFLKRVDISHDTMIYAIADSGGAPGKALDMCRDILEERGFKLAGGFLINMPGNYILGYGAESAEKQRKLFAGENKKVKYICECINNNKLCGIEKSHLVVDRLFTNYVHRDVKNFHEHDKNFHVNDRCTGCGLCANRCPVKNITIDNNKPVWNHKCELCLACLQSCPKEAINYGEKTEGRKRYLNPNVTL